MNVSLLKETANSAVNRNGTNAKFHRRTKSCERVRSHGFHESEET